MDEQQEIKNQINEINIKIAKKKAELKHLEADREDLFVKHLECSVQES